MRKRVFYETDVDLKLNNEEAKISLYRIPTLSKKPDRFAWFGWIKKDSVMRCLTFFHDSNPPIGPPYAYSFDFL